MWYSGLYFEKFLGVVVEDFAFDGLAWSQLANSGLNHVSSTSPGLSIRIGAIRRGVDFGDES